MALLYDPAKGPMRVAGFMSGTGNNIRRVIERQRELGEGIFKVVVLFSDRPGSKATEIGNEFGIPVVINDARKFYSERGKDISDMSIRDEFDTETIRMLDQECEFDVIVLGGYMLLASPTLINSYPGINIHPADLSIKGADGKPRFTGDKAVALAMEAGERFIRSSAHIIVEKADEGPILLMSRPHQVDYTKTPKENQDALKKSGDLVVLPLAVEWVARGLYEIINGVVHFKGRPYPNGPRLEDLESE